MIMTNINYFRRSSFWISALAVLGFLLLALTNSVALAAPIKRNVNFDHVKTGFPLTGAHVTLPCETCHIQGTFKGTPKKCATCHTQGSRMQTTTFKPTNHITTTQACDQCHSSTASWSVARFSHVGVVARQCTQCHDNRVAKGKPSNHMLTNAPCDSCHRTTTWSSASFTHVDVKPGSCATCHIQGGSASTYKPSKHISTNLSCDACHTTGGSFATLRFTHSAIQGVMPGQCETCHNGTLASLNVLGKAQASPTHISTSASCDTCHVGYVSFAGANQHAGVVASAGTCANSGCHTSGGAGKQKPSGNGHIPTNLTCNWCHNMTTFTPPSFTHSATQGVVAGGCETSGCHSGAYAALNVLGKAQASPTHVITSASCDTCHTSGYASFMGANNHAGVIASAGTCANSGCHTSGGAGKQKPTGNSHIPTSLTCNWCHNMTTFNPSSFTHSATQGVVAGQCGTCHSGTYAALNVLGKAQASPAHVTTSASCDTCHTGYVSFAGANQHAGVIASAGTCANSGCHTSGGAGLQKPSGNGHIPTNLTCNWCHNMTTFNPSSFTHSSTQGVVAGQCETCHNGTYASLNVLGKAQASPAHVTTSASCDTCHTSGYASFMGANQHAGVIASAGTCANSGCHTSGGAGMQKPSGNGHIPTSLTCNWCHNMTTFNPSSFTHSSTQGVVAGGCETAGCHSGTYAALNVLGKAQASPAHITTSASCDQCHKGYSSFVGGTFSHTGIAPGTCSTCHYKGGPGMAAPDNHIPYATQLLAGASMNCDSCHKNTNVGGFASYTMNHNNSLGNGAGWCKGCHASGTTFLGNMQKKALSHYEKYAGQTDCSASGCHKPLGNQGTAYSRWTN
jgi:hypothetical protein